MCGITGIYSFKNQANSYTQEVWKSLETMKYRGPDAQAIFEHPTAILGHARLSIIDTSSTANQPFTDSSGRFTIVFNGEIYNFQSFYKELISDGITFRTTSDTEVLLYLFIKYGKDCLLKLQGFFAFAIYDNETKHLFIARDRMGIKPLYYFSNELFFCFCSELNGLMSYPFQRTINTTGLFSYLQLQYIPAPLSILQDAIKLMPGTYLEITKNGVQSHTYYTIPYSKKGNVTISYTEAQKQLYSILENAVKDRLISDVPLGTFLSGGIDSSIVSTLASRHVEKLQTFSIGFTDNPYFDETIYANLVAKKIQSEHTVIPISTKDFSEHVISVLESIDEPFADSSAIAVYVLSKYVKPYVTVALSGDGADEIFAGYNKHKAHYSLLENSIEKSIIPIIHPFVKHLPQSRNSKFGNTIRKINRFAEGLHLPTAEAYWRWCSVQSEFEASRFLIENYSNEDYLGAKLNYTKHFSKKNTINDILYADQILVLPNDMLTKVDRMSMANSLEVRSPFLDYRLIEFVNSLPPHFKIDTKFKKKILQYTFKNELPIELYNRPKQGFEVPLHFWCTTILQDSIKELLSKDYLQKQKIFNWEPIEKLLIKLHSNNPGDSAAQVWALIVFQYWYKKYIN